MERQKKRRQASTIRWLDDPKNRWLIGIIVAIIIATPPVFFKSVRQWCGVMSKAVGAFLTSSIEIRSGELILLMVAPAVVVFVVFCIIKKYTSKIKQSPVEQTAKPEIKYTQDAFFGMIWRWTLGTQVGYTYSTNHLDPYCPQCGMILAIARRAGDTDSTIRYFMCDDCRDRHHVDGFTCQNKQYRIEQYINKHIDQGTWKQAPERIKKLQAESKKKSE